MKKSGYRSIIHLYILLLIILCVVIAACVGAIIYSVSTVMPDGKTTLNKWPIEFTRDFAGQVDLSGEAPAVRVEGITLLDQNGLWLQLIDETGREVLSHNKPASVQSQYSPAELLAAYNSVGESGYTTFIGSPEDNGEWVYIIGFPVQIEKVTMYLDANRFTNGRPVALILLLAAAVIILTLGGAYGVWITRQLRRITGAVSDIASRSYSGASNTGMFSDVFDSLGRLDYEIKRSDEEKRKTEIAREEWIANITHDLKTPLSPIRGYAEMLAESGCSPDDAIRYGAIILKNTAYAESLVDDLKLTYQLKNNMLPIKRKPGDITRFIKELVIDILNDPRFENRSVEFSGEDIDWSFDRALTRRAIYNMLVNALTHNPPDTEISVSLTAGTQLFIHIRDNGAGMGPDELGRLFERYYRGTNIEEGARGTGLGMAIARQIVELHGGEIALESSPGIGTDITVSFPLST